MPTLPCDVLASPVQHQQLVTISAIVHTDMDMQTVTIPPFVPLFYQTDEAGKAMHTDGVVHVTLGGTLTGNEALEQYIGVSIDPFTAQVSRGDAYNRISVAISGLVNVALPQQKSANATIFSSLKFDDDNMRYEAAQEPGQTCKYLFPDSSGTVATYMGPNTVGFDGIVALLKAKPTTAPFAATAGSLGSAAAAPAPAAARVSAAPAAAPAVATIFRDPADSSDDDIGTMSIKRARPASKTSKTQPKKKGRPN